MEGSGWPKRKAPQGRTEAWTLSRRKPGKALHNQRWTSELAAHYRQSSSGGGPMQKQSGNSTSIAKGAPKGALIRGQRAMGL